jgi:hypothetical protein
MGATHFLTKTLKNVRTEMSLQVLAYNMKRMINMFGVKPLVAAIAAYRGGSKNIASLPWMRTQRQSTRSHHRVFPRPRTGPVAGGVLVA